MLTHSADRGAYRQLGSTVFGRLDDSNYFSALDARPRFSRVIADRSEAGKAQPRRVTGYRVRGLCDPAIRRWMGDRTTPGPEDEPTAGAETRPEAGYRIGSRHAARAKRALRYERRPQHRAKSRHVGIFPVFAAYPPQRVLAQSLP